MAEISDWRLTELKEHEKSYYELKKEKENLCSALTPIFQQLLENIDYETQCFLFLRRKESRWRYIADTRGKTEYVVIASIIKECQRVHM